MTKSEKLRVIAYTAKMVKAHGDDPEKSGMRLIERLQREVAAEEEREKRGPEKREDARTSSGCSDFSGRGAELDAIAGLTTGQVGVTFDGTVQRFGAGGTPVKPRALLTREQLARLA